jgi:putative acetyltransferase
MMSDKHSIRPVRDADAQGLLGLIALCFAEYPGCFVDPHDDLPDLVRPTQSRLAQEGAFDVVEDGRGHIAACVGVDFPEPGTAELHRLYVRPDMRGQGLGKLLTARMEAMARAQGAKRMILWSDTRFTTAHALYLKLGYSQGLSRSLEDISRSREFSFGKAL